MFSDKTIIFADTAKSWTHTFPEFVTNALTIRAYFVNTIDIGQGSCTPTHCIMVYYLIRIWPFPSSSSILRAIKITTGVRNNLTPKQQVFNHGQVV